MDPRPKLNSEQKEEIQSLYDSTYWAPLMSLIEALTLAQERAVLQCVLDPGDSNSPLKLALLKSRSEGARRLQAALTAEVHSIRDESNRLAP